MNAKTPTDSELQCFTKLFPITSIPTREDNENYSEENFSGILYGSFIDYWIGCLGLVGQTGGCLFFNPRILLGKHYRTDLSSQPSQGVKCVLTISSMSQVLQRSFPCNPAWNHWLLQSLIKLLLNMNACRLGDSSVSFKCFLYTIFYTFRE